MNMILLDWTRMGKFYCLAGAVSEGRGWKFVRPLLSKYKDAAIRNVGWSPFLLTNHRRWEMFKLVDPKPAPPQPPHLEDMWIMGMKSLRKMAPVKQRRAILEAGLREEGQPLFGVRLSPTKTAAYLEPNTGTRSLATMLVTPKQITFRAFRGDPEPDIRVTLDVTGLATRSLPVKDHWLLLHGEQAGPDLSARLQIMTALIQHMGNNVAVRLGLSRGFNPNGEAESVAGFARIQKVARLNSGESSYDEDKEAKPQAAKCCWLMADGFFSFDDPQS